MDKVFLPFYYEWAECIDGLSDEDYGRLVRSILAYAEGKEETPTLSPSALMAYKFITAAINRSEQNRKNGQKGGQKRVENIKKTENAEAQAEVRTTCEDEPTAEQNPTLNVERVQEKPTAEQNPTLNVERAQEKPSVPEREEVKSSPAKESSIPSQTPQVPLEPPSLDEVRDYFKNRKFKSNPDEFFNFYESNGWRVGQNPMKNWRASATNWELKSERDAPRGYSRGNGAVHERQGDFDVSEAFETALKRSYADTDSAKQEENENQSCQKEERMP